MEIIGLSRLFICPYYSRIHTYVSNRSLVNYKECHARIKPRIRASLILLWIFLSLVCCTVYDAGWEIRSTIVISQLEILS